MTLSQLDAFALTLLIEGATGLVLATALRRAPLACALAAIAGSTVTHPILWAIYSQAHGYFGALTTPVLEALVITAETPAYRILATPRWEEATLMSLLANAASWWAGELIHAV